MTACIYGLVDPRDNRVFYIGQTKKNHILRLKEHIRDCKRTHTYKNHKISQILEQNLILKIVILEWIYNTEILSEREKYYIKYYNGFYKLTNANNGGYGNSNGNGYKGQEIHLSKLSEKDVREIVDLYKNTNMTTKEIGKIYNVSRATINSITCGKNWKHINSGKIYSLYEKKRPCFGVKNPMAKLSENDVLEIRKLKKDGMSVILIAQKYNVSDKSIYSICSNNGWKHI